MIVDLEGLHDCFDGGAWPFVVRGMICQVESGNGRDWGGIVRTFALADGT